MIQFKYEDLNEKSISDMVMSILRECKDGCSSRSFEVAFKEFIWNIHVAKNSNLKFEVSIKGLDDKEIARIGESTSENHRYLRVFKSIENLKKWEIAKIILDIINRLEGVLKEENVRRYNLINFYLHEGYVPVKRQDDKDEYKNFGVEELKYELVEYLHTKEKGLEFSYKEAIPITTMEYNPEKALEYLADVQSLRDKLRNS